MKKISLIIVGLSGGTAVGAGIFALFTALGVVTRIIDIGKTQRFEYHYKIAILLGSLTSTLVYTYGFNIKLGKGWLIISGLFMGIFVGMVASALAEVINVIPFLTTYMVIDRWLYLLIVGLILGKVIGSLLYWILPGFY